MAGSGSNHGRDHLHWSQCLKRYIPAILSVLLISAAQLLLRIAMRDVSFSTLAHLAYFCSRSGWFLFSGISCYLLSFFVWLYTLRQLPLSQAYPLLSLSYVLVWAGAMALPLLNESFHFGSLLGIFCILAGLLRFYLPPLVKS